MPISCHEGARKASPDAKHFVALAGNPNVGKSAFFNTLTGGSAVTANYPGKTVEVEFGEVSTGKGPVAVMDLPGTYSLGWVSEDQWVARQALVDSEPDAILCVVDSTNLARNLFVVLQMLEMGLPLTVALNLTDEAEKRGIVIDSDKLRSRLGVPVVKTVAITGAGVHEAFMKALETIGERSEAIVLYSSPLRESIERIAELVRQGDRHGVLDPKGFATLLLEGDSEALRILDEDLVAEVAKETDALRAHYGMPASIVIARERHELAEQIAQEVTRREDGAQVFGEKAWRVATSSRFGLPILVMVLLGIFSFIFFVGNFLSTLLSNAWSAFVSPAIQTPLYSLMGNTPVARTLVWGFDAGILASLAVGIPYVLTFYFLLAFLEDSGYMNAASFLMHRTMRRLGLNGRAAIPLISGLGCSVPAIIGTRVLNSKRERWIACTLVNMIPCSARTAVIFGAVGLYAGLVPALSIYLIALGLILAVGLALNKMMPGKPPDLVMEVFPFRMPQPRSLAFKTWHRFKHFLLVAMPIVIVGSLILGGLYETGVISYLSAPLAPVVGGWLGLPAVAGLALIFAFLRKELALQLLVALAVIQYGAGAQSLNFFMTPVQLFVYALVTTIYVPCIATFAVVGRELGWKGAITISAMTIGLALLVGGLAMRILTLA